MLGAEGAALRAVLPRPGSALCWGPRLSPTPSRNGALWRVAWGELGPRCRKPARAGFGADWLALAE
eukprot:10181601-Alexandrium_andersonii.AAC.1